MLHDPTATAFAPCPGSGYLSSTTEGTYDPADRLATSAKTGIGGAGET